MTGNNAAIRVESVVRILTYSIGFVGFLSVLRHISPSYAVAFGFLYALAVYFDYRRTFLVPRWVLTGAAILVIVLTLFRMRADDPVVSAVEALLILLVIKSFEEKRFRDYMQIYLISLFLLAGCALFTFDMEFLGYFIFFFFLMTIAVVLLTYFSQDNDLRLPVKTMRSIISKAALIPLLSIPVTVMMFIILPRTAYPFFTFLNRGTIANTGFSDNVSLGKVSDIQEDSAVILRAHMERVSDDALYWRGIVFDYFDGTAWKSSKKEKLQRSSPPMPQGKKVTQTIYLEPYGNRYLFALDWPLSIQLKGNKKNQDLSYTVHGSILRRIQYETVSVLAGSLPEGDLDSMYLQRPENSSGKLDDLVKGLSAGKSREEVIKAVSGYLRDGDFRYSLENLPVSDHPLDDFLFKHKYGNCEFFASAMALMLRTAGIPSRLIGGYRGGYYNDAGGYYLVPQKNAHVWVEAYLDNRGWIRVDPTPLAIEGFVVNPKRGLLFKVRLVLDTLSYHWNASIINYDFSKQLSLFNRLRALKKPSFHIRVGREALMSYVTVVVAAVAGILALYVLLFKRKSPEERILRAFLMRMRRLGYTKSGSEGLEEFAGRISDEQLRKRAYTFVREFESHFYRDRKLESNDARKLRDLLKAVRPA